MQAIFLAGAALTVLVVLRVVQLIYWRQLRSHESRGAAGRRARAGLIGLLVGFYFLNWIPPVPLSMKFGGMYHEVKRSPATISNCRMRKRWFQVWQRSNTTVAADEPIYCFTAVFAPVTLKTTVYHHWYYRSDKSKPFSHADKIPSKFPGGVKAGIAPTRLSRGWIR
jgi:hypothetical protein